jgi:hypothetical protein
MSSFARSLAHRATQSQQCRGVHKNGTQLPHVTLSPLMGDGVRAGDASAVAIPRVERDFLSWITWGGWGHSRSMARKTAAKKIKKNSKKTKASTPRAGFLAALRKASTEGPVHRWLKKNPLVVSRFASGFSFPNKVISQFKFGTDYVADFVAVGSFSGGCSVHFIELEPPGAKLFTKAGDAARRLNGAITQLIAWELFVSKHREEVLREIAKRMLKHELVSDRGIDVQDNTGRNISSPMLVIQWHYHIVIGRRQTMSNEDIERKAALFQKGIDVVTYDRLLDYLSGGPAFTDMRPIPTVLSKKDRVKMQ